MWWSRFWTAGNCELLILSILWPSIVPTLRDTDETVGHNRGCVDLLGFSRGNIFHLAWMAVQVWQCRFGSPGLAAQVWQRSWSTPGITSLCWRIGLRDLPCRLSCLIIVKLSFSQFSDSNEMVVCQLLLPAMKPLSPFASGFTWMPNMLPSGGWE